MTGDVRRKIERCASGLMKYLHLLEASGRYKLRKNIRLSDVELQRYFDLMKSEVLLLTVDAIAFEAFLAHEDERLGPGLGMHLLGIRRRSLVERWAAYSAGIKDGLAVKDDKVKLEEKTDEQYYEKGRDAAGNPEGDAGGGVAGQIRAVPDPQLGERRKGRGPASEHGPDTGGTGAPVRHTPGMGDPSASFMTPEGWVIVVPAGVDGEVEKDDDGSGD